jgi:hypothetical protein
LSVTETGSTMPSRPCASSEIEDRPLSATASGHETQGRASTRPGCRASSDCAFAGWFQPVQGNEERALPRPSTGLLVAAVADEARLPRIIAGPERTSRKLKGC